MPEAQELVRICKNTVIATDFCPSSPFTVFTGFTLFHNNPISDGFEDVLGGHLHSTDSVPAGRPPGWKSQEPERFLGSLFMLGHCAVMSQGRVGLLSAIMPFLKELYAKTVTTCTDASICAIRLPS